MKKCGSCGTQIIWVWNEAGDRFPLEAMPVENGTFYLRPLRPHCTQALRASRSKTEGVLRFNAHTSCANPGQQIEDPRQKGLFE